MPIVRAPCQFGSSRPYFLCPGVVDGITCGRRVVKLYQRRRYFLCRHCYRLDYASQREDEMDRALRRAHKIRLRLGGAPDRASPFPKRPTGMWWRTYDRLRAIGFAAEMQANEAFVTRAQRFLATVHRGR